MPRGRPFEKGKSANPKGRPQGSKNKTTLLREKLMSKVLTPERIIGLLAMLFKQAMGGDTAAAKLLLEFLWGKPHQSADVTVAPDVDGVRAMQEMFGFRDVEYNYDVSPN